MMWLLLVGLSVSANLGERTPGWMMRAVVHGDRWEVQGRVDGSDKIGGAGWLGQAVAQTAIGSGLLLGGEFTWRDGGAWVKQSGGLRLGWVFPRRQSALQLAARATWTLGLPEQSLGGHLEYRRFLRDRWVVTMEYDAGFYRQHGWAPGSVLGLTLGVR